MAITETNVSELKAVDEEVRSMSLAAMRAAQESIPRILDALQRRLYTLQGAQQLLLQKINKFHDLAGLEQFAGDRFVRVTPAQAYEHKQIGLPNPDDRTVLYTNRIKQYEEGIMIVDAEVRKMQYEVGTVQQTINRYNRQLELVNERLSKEKNLKKSDQDLNKISDMKTEEVMNLYQIWLEYKRNTTAANERTGFTDNPKMTAYLRRLNNRFVAMAKRNSFVQSGELTLDLDNFSSDSNGTALLNMINKLRGISKITLKTYEKVTSFGNQLNRLINDSFASRNLSRKPEPDRLPEAENSQKNQLSFLGKAYQFLGSYNSLDYGAYADSVTSWFKKTVSNLHNSIKFCDPPETTASDTAKEAEDSENQQAESTASSEFQKEKSRS